MAGELRQRIGIGECCEVARVELRAVSQVRHARERADIARGDDPRSTRLRQAADEPEAFCLRMSQAIQHELALLVRRDPAERLAARLERYRRLGT